MSQHDTPRIYAADLAAYNSGILRGIWIDCEDKDADAIGDEIDAMLRGSPEPNVTRRRCNACGKHFDVGGFDHHDIRSTVCPRCDVADSSEIFASAEEWAIHDHEGFAGLIHSEWPAIADLQIFAEGLAGGHRFGFLFLVNERGLEAAEALAKADEVQIYQADAHDLAGEYAQELAEETIDGFADKISQWPFSCIDWKEAGRELVMGGDVERCKIDGERCLVTNPRDF